MTTFIGEIFEGIVIRSLRSISNSWREYFDLYSLRVVLAGLCQDLPTYGIWVDSMLTGLVKSSPASSKSFLSLTPEYGVSASSHLSPHQPRSYRSYLIKILIASL